MAIKTRIQTGVDVKPHSVRQLSPLLSSSRLSPRRHRPPLLSQFPGAQSGCPWSRMHTDPGPGHWHSSSSRLPPSAFKDHAGRPLFLECLDSHHLVLFTIPPLPFPHHGRLHGKTPEAALTLGPLQGGLQLVPVRVPGGRAQAAFQARRVHPGVCVSMLWVTPGVPFSPFF